MKQVGMKSVWLKKNEWKTRRKRVKRLHSGTTSDKLILKFYQSTKG